MAGLSRGQKHDLNIRAAFIHMVGDALGAVGILAGAFIIRYTGWVYVDPILSIAYCAADYYTAPGISFANR